MTGGGGTTAATAPTSVQIGLWPNVISVTGCSSYGESCHTIDSADRFAASASMRSWRTMLGEPLSWV
jgi:hypothetical protein